MSDIQSVKAIATRDGVKYDTLHHAIRHAQARQQAQGITPPTAFGAFLKENIEGTRRSILMMDADSPDYTAWLSRHRQGKRGPRVVPETPEQKKNQRYWQLHGSKYLSKRQQRLRQAQEGAVAASPS